MTWERLLDTAATGFVFSSRVLLMLGSIFS